MESRAEVLVVEDSRAQRALLSAILSSDGHAVTEAADGREGEARARSRRFDLVITDYEMPGMNGDELTRRLRELPEYRTTPIVIMSARADLDSRVNGLSVGAHDYLVKPLAQREVTARVQSLLQLGRAQRALEVRNGQLTEALAEVRRCQSRLIAGEKLAYAGRLATGIGHECNSPLQVLSLGVDALGMYGETLIGAIPFEARGEELAEARTELPRLVGECTRMVERLHHALAQLRGLQDMTAVAPAAHPADLRRAVARAIDLAGSDEVRQALPDEPVAAVTAHEELAVHVATLLRHIYRMRAARDVTVRLEVDRGQARIEIATPMGTDPAELLGSELVVLEGTVRFDMSVSAAREGLLRLGAGIETFAGADRVATLRIALPLEPARG